MRHHIFEEAESYKLAILIKATSFNKGELFNNYVTPLGTHGIPANNIIAFTLDYNDKGKAPVAHIKEYLNKLLPALDSIGVTTLYVADANFFKVLAGKTTADPHIGYVLPCAIKGYKHMSVVLGVNYQALIYNPVLQGKLDRTLTAVSSTLLGSYQVPGSGIIHSANYPNTLAAIKAALDDLHQYPSLTCDIEGFSLKFYDAGIGTIAFAWDQHNGIAFACDYNGEANVPNPEVRALIKEFLIEYQGEVTYHNAPYDVKAIICALWMDNLLDTQGMLTGLDIMCRNMHDTKIIAYLAVNSTAGNNLGLKDLAQEFAGNYAVDDVKNILLVPLDELLEYNLVDTLCTHYVRSKYEPLMEKDNQGDLYRGLMLDTLKLLIQLEMVGMPMSRTKIIEAKKELEAIRDTELATITNSPIIKTMNLIVQTKAMETANAKLKVKQHPLSKFADEVFNPNSGPQLQVLLYKQMGLPVLDLTDTKQPATGADTIDKLINHTNVPEYKALLAALISYGKVSKILSTFIPAFEQAISKDSSDTVWLHGSFNLGGTVSGRLSSSAPNLQNLPAGSEYGRLIKQAFISTQAWLMAGADFNSLEDMISALTTKDQNKLKVYIDGFDGHALRAAYYFKEELAHIDVNDPTSVNQLKEQDHPLRQESKAPTFLLTYGGTYHGMMSNLGWSKEKSLAIEENYHSLYAESDEYVRQRLQQASKDGYVEVAFGLRVRTPLLAQVVFNSPKMPFEAAEEGRTAGNALGQSYGLLNNRAAVDFMKKVWASPYRYDILPIGLIHDAIYILIRNRVDIVEWANRELTLSMQWQELPEIQHPTVKLGAALDIFYKNWSQPITIPITATQKEILKLTNEGAYKYDSPK